MISWGRYMILSYQVLYFQWQWQRNAFELLSVACVHAFFIVLYFNLLRPSDAIWRQRSGSTLAQVMACCLTAPSHYLNLRWFIISKVKWHSSKSKFTRDNSVINHWNYLKFHSNFPGANELNDRIMQLHDDVIKWNHFPRYWPLVRGIQWSPADSPLKG